MGKVRRLIDPCDTVYEVVSMFLAPGDLYRP